jgi:hypothetical protein
MNSKAPDQPLKPRGHLNFHIFYGWRTFKCGELKKHFIQSSAKVMTSLSLSAKKVQLFSNMECECIKSYR